MIGMKKLLLIFFIFLLGLIYIVLPGPSSIDDLPGLPGSAKSDLPGDTIQNPNIAGFYSQFRRNGITQYYKNIFSKMLIPGVSLPIIVLNHPPEAAYKYVRDQQSSTFLEEYIFPLRESVFVNGYEPKMENYMKGRIEDESYVGHFVKFNGDYYNSKTTLRFYPSNVWVRIFVYVEIWIVLWCMYHLFRRLIKE